MARVIHLDPSLLASKTALPGFVIAKARHGNGQLTNTLLNLLGENKEKERRNEWRTGRPQKPKFQIEN
jgi:hypothetical protein